MTVKTLAGVRNLKDPTFAIVCRELYKEHTHAALWVKNVFALAGFREEVFYKAVETYAIPINKTLRESDIDAVITIAISEASRAKETKAGYEYEHPDLGKFTVRHGHTVGPLLAIKHKKGGWHLFQANGRQLPRVEKSAIENHKFILVDSQGKSAYLKASDFIGFWSNFMEDPREEDNSFEKVFKK